MLRKASVLLGLAVLLSLLFPVQGLLKQGGIEPSSVGLAGIDLAGVCALVAVLPALLLARDAKLALRMPRWNAWIALLALFSILFLVLHVSWTEEVAGTWLRGAIAQGQVPASLTEYAVLRGADLLARFGVLVNLQAVPDEDAPVRPRRSRQ